MSASYYVSFYSREMSTFVRAAEANELAAGIADERVRALVRFGLTTLLTLRGMSVGLVPEADIDLLVFAEALRSMGTNHAVMLRIVAGDLASMEWWPGGEDGP